MCLRVIPDNLKNLTIYLLQCSLYILSQWTAFCSRSAYISNLYELSHLFLMPLIVLESPLCPQGYLRLLEENLEESCILFDWRVG